MYDSHFYIKGYIVTQAVSSIRLIDYVSTCIEFIIAIFV
uniref:Uncharacterized protein n=1 Tax=Setaria italica TaxID=4555 RepID=K3YF42_SETIT